MMPNLWQLILSENPLSGRIPSSIQKMSHLLVLSLSDNQLSGEVLKFWSKSNLHIIDLANNDLYGKIPSSIGLLTSLEQLILRNNHLYGEIPRTLQSCSHIKSIDLSENKLNGSLPSWIGVTLPRLILLDVGSNLFSGTIPRQWCNLSSLRVVDFSQITIFWEKFQVVCIIGQLSSMKTSQIMDWTTFM